jgi:hypothetical protein
VKGEADVFNGLRNVCTNKSCTLSVRMNRSATPLPSHEHRARRDPQRAVFRPSGGL